MIEIPRAPLSVHVAFEAAAYLSAALVYARSRREDPIPTEVRSTVLAAAAIGALVGSKILFWLVDPVATWAHRANFAFLLGGKTIVGALLGGIAAVEVAKRWIGERRSTGDRFVAPLLVGIVVGRFGCLFTALADHTAGAPTMVPWGVDFGDGVSRHPAPLYEILFASILLAVLPAIRAFVRDWPPGTTFRVVAGEYFLFRIAGDSLKSDPKIFAGLSTLQLASLAGLGYHFVLILRSHSTVGRISDSAI